MQHTEAGGFGTEHSPLFLIAFLAGNLAKKPPAIPRLAGKLHEVVMMLEAGNVNFVAGYRRVAEVIRGKP